MGYLFSVQVNPWQHTDIQERYVEVQTCETGVGLHAKATLAGLYGAGLQYGFTADFGKFSLTFQPKAGISYADRPFPELPMRTQFEIGGGLLVGYQKYRVGVEYWHLSNAGLRDPNIGLDMVGVTLGRTF